MLARRGVIDVALADRLGRIVARRDRLAHGDATIDVNRLWAEVPAGTEALDRYASAIARFLPPVA